MSAVKSAVGRLVTISTPATAQRTAWLKETAAPTTRASAKVGPNSVAQNCVSVNH